MAAPSASPLPVAKVAKAPAPPQWVPHPLPDGTLITAEAAILMDADSGRVLWEYHSDRRMYPASLTKMMTGLLAAESPHLDRVFQASAVAAATGESSIALAAGESLKLREVLEASLIKSANDATVMVAEAVGGTVPQFVALMNARAATLGLRGTHFANPHGLHNAAHYSTAADLGAIARAGMLNPTFARIVGTRETTIPWAGKPWRRKLVNRNRLLLRWPQCDGVKTGYTRQAGRCLAASASVNGRRLLCVVLKCKDSWQDAQNVLQWGFRSYTHQCVASRATLYEVGVKRGKTRRVAARPERDLYVVLAPGETAPPVLQERKAAVAPIASGQPVGTLTVGAGAQAQSVRLLAIAAVPESLWARLCDLKLPQISTALLVLLAAGVLVHGAGAKAARARRRRLAARKRTSDRPGQSDDQRRTG